MTDVINEHREDLEALAKSDLNVNWIADALLEATDDEVTGRCRE